MNDKVSDKRVKFSIWYVLAIILVMTLIQTFVIGPLLNQQTEITYSEFKTALRDGEIASVSVGQERISGTYEDGEAFYTVPVEDPDLLQELEAQEVEVKGEVASDGGLLGGILGWILPLALMAGFWYWMMGRMKGDAAAWPAWAAMKSASRRSTSCWRRWTVLNPMRTSSS